MVGGDAVGSGFGMRCLDSIIRAVKASLQPYTLNCKQARSGRHGLFELPWGGLRADKGWYEAFLWAQGFQEQPQMFKGRVALSVLCPKHLYPMLCRPGP